MRTAEARLAEWHRLYVQLEWARAELAGDSLVRDPATQASAREWPAWSRSSTWRLVRCSPSSAPQGTPHRGTRGHAWPDRRCASPARRGNGSANASTEVYWCKCKAGKSLESGPGARRKA